jgi:response regulator NasT
MKSLESEVADIYERLETRKVIDRAKGILMKAMNLSEPESFSWIQKTAMDRRISMKEVAMAIIDPNLMPDLGH